MRGRCGQQLLPTCVEIDERPRRAPHVALGCTSPAAPLLTDAFWDTVTLVPQMVEQLVPKDRVVRTDRIQEPMGRADSGAGGGITSETLFSNQAKLFWMRDGQWEAKAKNRQSLFYEAKGEHNGNYRQFLRAQRP